jgi:nucleoside-diphosphate-sugar epimerase
VFQIASGRETSVRSLLEAMKAILPERKFEVRFEPARAEEILRNYATIDKVRRILGFDPKTKLNEGLKKTWE